MVTCWYHLPACRHFSWRMPIPRHDGFLSRVSRSLSRVLTALRRARIFLVTFRRVVTPWLFTSFIILFLLILALNTHSLRYRGSFSLILLSARVVESPSRVLARVPSLELFDQDLPRTGSEHTVRIVSGPLGHVYTRLSLSSGGGEAGRGTSDLSLQSDSS